MKYLLVLLFLAPSLLALGQADKDDLRDLKKSTLYVIAPENRNQYEMLEAVMEEEWTFSEYKFIDINDLGRYVSDENNFIMTPYELSYSEGGTFPKFGIVRAGKNCDELFCRRSEILEYVDFDPYRDHSNHLFVLAFRALNFRCENGYNGKVKLPLNIKNKKFSYYNDGKRVLRKRTILINEEELYDRYKEEKIIDLLNKASDHGNVKIKITTPEEIEKALFNKNEEYAILDIKVHPRPNKFRGLLYAPEDGRRLALATTIRPKILLTIGITFASVIIALAIAAATIG